MLGKMKTFLFILSVFASTFAQELVNTANNCGGDFMGSSGEITSPNYNPAADQNYPPGAYCVWQITVPFGMQIQFTFEKIDVEYAPPECTFDGIVMYDVTDDLILNVTEEMQTSRYIGKTRFCGDLDIPPVKSHTNRVVVAFYSDEDTEAHGFNITWEAVPTPPDQFDCDFEQGLCEGWVDLGYPNDQFDWEFQKRGTRTALTGPTYDHTLKNENGQYAFIEASLPRKPNEEAILITPERTFGSNPGDMCLLFWYHMYGSSIGSLKVAIMVGNTSTISWFKSGDQGQRWIEGRMTIPHQYEPFRIVFIGVRGRGHQGDIALDDVTMENTSCAEVTTTEMPATEATSTTASTTSPPPNCKLFEYACASGSKCIPEFYKCDGMDDCPDRDDELNCADIVDVLPPILTSEPMTTTTVEPPTSSAVTSQATTTAPQVSGCPDDYLPCPAGNCIPAFWLCDGEEDCTEGEDELNCPDDGDDDGGWIDYGIYDNGTDLVNNTSTNAPGTTQTLLVTETTSLAPSTEATTLDVVTTSVTSVSTASSTENTVVAVTSDSIVETTKTTDSEVTAVETTESDVTTTVTDAVTTTTTDDVTSATTGDVTTTTQTEAAQTTTMLATESQTTTKVGDASIASQTSDVTTATQTSDVTTATQTDAAQTTTMLATESRTTTEAGDAIIVPEPSDVTTKTEEKTATSTTVEVPSSKTTYTTSTTNDAIANTVTFTPKLVSTTTTTPVITTTLQSTATGAKRGGDGGGAASVRSQSIFVLLLQTLATVFVAMVLCPWR